MKARDRLPHPRRHARLPGKPDFVWPKLRVALFVDGCFWHGHACGRNLTPKNNAEHWNRKIEATRRRDATVREDLRVKGWTVVGVWECQLKREPAECADLIRTALTRTPGG